MQNDAIYAAAVILDDIASGTLTESDFYLYMEEAGIASVDLCKLVIRDRIQEDSTEYHQIILAADCLKDICIAQDNNKLSAALSSTKIHSENLYRIMERMGQA